MTTVKPQDFAHHGFRILLVTVIAPVVITVAAVIVLVSLAASGPSRVATHWVFSGEANGYGSPFTYPILMVAIAVPLIALLGGGSVVLAHRGPLSPVIKLAAVAPAWMSTFLGILFVNALLRQRTVAAVSTASAPGLDLLVGVLVALALAVGAWFVLPRAARRSAESEPPATPAVALATDERASWIRTASVSHGVLLVLVLITVVVGAVELVVISVSDGKTWWLAFVPALLLILLLCNFAWSIRVDSRGVRIRSAFGVPTIWIPLDNIVSASVVQAQAISEFGGYGVRWNLNGKLGVILRSGEALEIRRRKGLTVVVTVDDATTAAALINGLVQRGAAVA